MPTEDRSWKSTVISGAGTVVVLARRGWLGGAVLTAATGVLDIYNDPASTNLKVLSLSHTISTTADHSEFPEPVYCGNGITAIITTGGTATIAYSDSP